MQQISCENLRWDWFGRQKGVFRVNKRRTWGRRTQNIHISSLQQQMSVTVTDKNTKCFYRLPHRDSNTTVCTDRSIKHHCDTCRSAPQNQRWPPPAKCKLGWNFQHYSQLQLVDKVKVGGWGSHDYQSQELACYWHLELVYLCCTNKVKPLINLPQYSFSPISLI